MGYYSFVNLSIEQSEVTVEQIAETLAEVTDDPDSLFWNSALCGDTDIKWYNHTEDMKKVSARHPDALLVLSGEGEDHDDYWVEYHQNGKAQVEVRPVWEPPPFDPAKLK